MIGLEYFMKTALDEGGDKAVLIDVGQIIVDERVRLKCKVPICGAYNNNLMCPPNSLTIDEFRELLKRYSRAILIQIKAQGSDENSIIDAELKVLNIINSLETNALMRGYYFAGGFGAAYCRLCDECVGINSGERCRHPFRARPSMESIGIDVYKTCINAGIPIKIWILRISIFPDYCYWVN